MIMLYIQIPTIDVMARMVESGFPFRNHLPYDFQMAQKYPHLFIAFSQEVNRYDLTACVYHSLNTLK